MGKIIVERFILPYRTVVYVIHDQEIQPACDCFLALANSQVKFHYCVAGVKEEIARVSCSARQRNENRLLDK